MYLDAAHADFAAPAVVLPRQGDDDDVAAVGVVATVGDDSGVFTGCSLPGSVHVPDEPIAVNAGATPATATCTDSPLADGDQF